MRKVIKAMNIVYLIGNGFDLAQDLKTSYQEFYKSYKESSPVNEVEKQIISSITDHIETWSNMEKRLGSFTKELDGVEGFEDAYESLYLKLKKYLLAEEDKYVAKNKDRFRKEMANPFLDLSYREQKEYHGFTSRFFGVSSIINVVTFNYTEVFERAIGYQYQPIQLQGDFFPDGIQLNNVYKVHGSLQGTFLMGVNDTSQISNPSFAADQNICDFLVKPLANQNMGLYFDQFSMDVIGSANLIIVYGMSIGETDRQWWKKVAETLKSPNVRMIIFHHMKEPIPEDRKWKEPKIKRDIKKQFEDIAEVPESQRAELDDKITVSLKGFLFNPHVVRYEPEGQ